MLPLDFVNFGHWEPKDIKWQINSLNKNKFKIFILIIGDGVAGIVLYCNLIRSWQADERVRKTEETLISSLTDVWIRLHDNFRDSNWASSLKINTF